LDTRWLGDTGGSVNVTSQIVRSPTAVQTGLNSGGGGGFSVDESTTWSSADAYEPGAKNVKPVTSTKPGLMRFRFLFMGLPFILCGPWGPSGGV
jgi:hypothetical protein